MKMRHRRLISVILSAAVMIFITAVSGVYAANAAPGNATGYINSRNGVNVRAKAETSSRRIAGIRDNGRVSILEEIFTSPKKYDDKNKWYKISYRGKVGYVRADLVGSVDYVASSGKTTDALNYRVGAGLKMNRKGTIRSGKRVSVVGTARAYGSKDLWYKVIVGGKYRYVCATWVKLDSTSSVKDKTKDDNKTKNNNTKNNDKNNKDNKPQKPSVPNGGVPGTGAPNAEPGNSVNGAPRGSGCINSSSGALVRAKATTGSARIEGLRDGKKVTILKEQFTSRDNANQNEKWYQISLGSRKGYVRSDLVGDLKYTAVTGTVTDDINVRSGAGTGMSRIDGLSKGKKVFVLCRSAEKGAKTVWYKVKYGSSYGYISSDYVSIADYGKTKVVEGPKGFIGTVYRYYQGNYGEVAGQNIGRGGCGATSVAVIVSSLLGREIDPPTVVRHQMSVRGWTPKSYTLGSYFKKAAQKWGLGFREYGKSEYRSALRFMQDRRAMMVVRVGRSRWTSGMHFFVVYGANGDSVEIVQVGYPKQPRKVYSFSRDIYPHLHDSGGVSMYMYYL